MQISSVDYLHPFSGISKSSSLSTSVIIVIGHRHQCHQCHPHHHHCNACVVYVIHSLLITIHRYITTWLFSTLPWPSLTITMILIMMTANDDALPFEIQYGDIWWCFCTREIKTSALPPLHNLISFCNGSQSWSSYFDQFYGQKLSQISINGPFVATQVAPNWWFGVDQGWAHPGWCVGTISRVCNGHRGGAPKGAKMAQNCHKWPFCGFSLWQIQNKRTGHPSVCWGADAGWELSIGFHRLDNGQICKIKSACLNIIAEYVETCIKHTHTHTIQWFFHWIPIKCKHCNYLLYYALAQF